MPRLIWILLVLVPCVAVAGDHARDRIEASMVVTGWLRVAPDGSVIRYTLDQQDKLPAPVVQVIGKTVPGWKFRPVLADGKPVVADAKMNLRVVASQQSKDQYIVSVQGATFGGDSSSETGGKATDSDKSAYHDPSWKSRKPPLYPIVAIRSQVTGIVYLALEIDRTGHVEQSVATQVNLRAMGLEGDMRFFRRAFANASIAAAKDWTFNISLASPGAKLDHWTVMVPVDFTLSGGDGPSGEPQYGERDMYVPGPTQPVPWQQDQVADDNNADALPNDGSVFTPDKRFALVTPPGG